MPRETSKRTWFVTYGASGPNIDPLKMIEAGFELIELHTLQQRDLKYSLFRLSKKTRLGPLQKKIEDFSTKNGIIIQEMVGFASIVGISSKDDTLTDHPGFKLMIENMKSLSPQFISWFKNGTIDENKDSLLWRFRDCDGFSDLTKSVLVKRLFDMSEKLRTFHDLEERCDLLVNDNEELKRDKEELKQENKKLKQDNREMKIQISVQRSVIRTCRLP